MKNSVADDQQNFVKTCMECGGITQIIDSRPTTQGAIWRKRNCPQCGYKFTTVEVEESMFDNFDLLEEIKSMKKQIRELKDKLHRAKNILEE